MGHAQATIGIQLSTNRASACTRMGCLSGTAITSRVPASFRICGNEGNEGKREKMWTSKMTFRKRLEKQAIISFKEGCGCALCMLVQGSLSISIISAGGPKSVQMIRYISYPKCCLALLKVLSPYSAKSPTAIKYSYSSVPSPKSEPMLLGPVHLPKI